MTNVWAGFVRSARATFAACVTGLAFAGAPARAEPAQRGERPNTPTVAFVGVNVVPLTPGSGVLRRQTVLVRAGRIAAVGPAARVAVPAGARRIDGTGRYLMPGLADMHVHLEHFSSPRLLALFVANGVTTVRNMDGRPHLLRWRDSVAKGELLGPRIYTAGPILDGDPPLGRDNQVVRNADEARAAVLEQAQAGYDFVKVYSGLSPEVYRAVLAAARERGLPVAGHIPRNVSVQDALASGQRSIEHLAEYGDLVEAEDSPFRERWHWSKLYLAMPVDTLGMDRAARRIAASGVWSVPTMVQADRALVPMDTVRRWLAAPELALLPREAPALWERQARGATGRMDPEDWAMVANGRRNRLRLLGALHRAGAPMLVGTDTPNPFVVPGYSVHDELATFVAAGMTPRQALAAATVEAARFLGVSGEWGTVEAGKRADLVMLAGNPLDDIRNARRPLGVMVQGRWLPAQQLRELLAPPR